MIPPAPEMCFCGWPASRFRAILATTEVKFGLSGLTSRTEVIAFEGRCAGCEPENWWSCAPGWLTKAETEVYEVMSS